MIIVNERGADISGSRDATDFGDITEGPIVFVVQQKDSVIQGNHQIRCTVVVVIPGRATVGMQFRIESRLLGRILKPAVAEIAIERHAALCAVVGQKQINESVAVIVQKTRPRAQTCADRGACFPLLSCCHSHTLRHIHKLNLDGGRRLQNP